MRAVVFGSSPNLYFGLDAEWPLLVPPLVPADGALIGAAVAPL